MKVVTANRLDDGAVVYLGADGGFVDNIAKAIRFSDSEADEALRIAQQPRLVTSAYLIEADEKGPVGRESLREQIRMKGPTVRRDLGKQAEALDERL